MVLSPNLVGALDHIEVIDYQALQIVPAITFTQLGPQPQGTRSQSRIHPSVKNKVHGLYGGGGQAALQPSDSQHSTLGWKDPPTRQQKPRRQV